MNIYKITNILNQKSYIGLTSLTVQERWKKHLCSLKARRLPKLYGAILKYGVSNFTIETIDTAASVKELSEKEVYWIRTLDTIKNGYNILEGGVKFNSDNQYCYWNIATPAEKDHYRKIMSPLSQGRKKHKVTSSSFIGVSKHRKTWMVEIMKEGKRLRRSFPTESTAAIAYDKFALYLFGPNARTNSSERYPEGELQEFYNQHLVSRRAISQVAPSVQPSQPERHHP